MRLTGDWEAWLAFFFEGVRETANGAVATQRRLSSLFDEDSSNIIHQGIRANSMLRLHQALMLQPIISLAEAQKRTALAFSTVSANMNSLVELGIAREITGRERNRLFAYDAYLQILSEGTEM